MKTVQPKGNSEGTGFYSKDFFQRNQLESLSRKPEVSDTLLKKIHVLLKTAPIIEGEPYESTRKKRRKRNMLLAQASTELALVERPLGMPWELMLEPTNGCNLKCPLCPTGNGTATRPMGKMTFAQYCSLIDELEDEIRRMIFWGFGEPLMHRDSARMIKYAADKKISVITSTNGTLLSNRRLAEGIVNSGLKTLYVALDGFTQETLSKYRVGANFEDILKGVRLVRSLRDTRGLGKPELVLQFVVTRENQHELELIEKGYRDLGFDKWSIKHANIMATSETENYDDLAEKFIPTDTNVSRFRRNDEGKLRVRGDIMNRCRLLFEQAMINWDGLVIPCCWDAQSEHQLGNALESGFTPVWFGKLYQAYRRQVFTDRKQIAICRDCPTDRTESKLSRQFTRL